MALLEMRLLEDADLPFARHDTLATSTVLQGFGIPQAIS
jgi:hypothetical protein